MTALPSRKLEAFRYTDLASLAATPFAAPVPVAYQDMFSALPLPRLVFTNGVFDAPRSTEFPYQRPFAAVREDSSLPLALINAEHAAAGVSIEIPPGVDAGVLLLLGYAASAAAFACHPRHRITLGAGARLTIIEVAKGAGVYWHNPVTDIALGDHAVLAHYRLQDEAADAFHLATIRVDIAQAAAYEGFTAVLGGKISRTETHVRLTGKAAHAQLNAALLLGGKQHGDVTAIVGHSAPQCTSRQTVKAVLDQAARGVFQGKILVERGAQKTDGYQRTQALLLSPDAEMDIKPELEIFADDVKCSHGATIGALDPEQMFYLRSRGIDEAAARQMLIRAFLDAALAPVEQADARAIFERAIEDWWARK